MRDLLFGAEATKAALLATAARAAAKAFALECRAIEGMVSSALPQEMQFTAGEVACVLNVSPQTGHMRLGVALAVTNLPRLLLALETGLIGVGHARALLDELEPLTAELADAVLHQLLPGLDEAIDPDEAPELEPLGRTPGELRRSARRAAIALEPELARRRHEAAKARTGVQVRAQEDGMSALVVTAEAATIARAAAAIRGLATAMPFDEPDLSVGEKDVAALAHALGCERTRVQAVVECPVTAAADLAALSGAGVWTLDLRIPLAVALGLSDHPAVLAGYGPIGADQARLLLPDADLLQACVDARTGEVLAASPPLRPARWAGDSSPGSAARTLALRQALLRMAAQPTPRPDLTTDAHDPSAALARLVDLRDVTSVFPGDATSARRSDRDYRLPYPLGATSEQNLQLSPQWHRAKHEAGWSCVLLEDGTVRWRSPKGGVFDRRPVRSPPPPIPPGTRLPDLPSDDGSTSRA